MYNSVKIISEQILFIPEQYLFIARTITIVPATKKRLLQNKKIIIRHCNDLTVNHT